MVPGPNNSLGNISYSRCANEYKRSRKNRSAIPVSLTLLHMVPVDVSNLILTSELWGKLSAA